MPSRRELQERREQLRQWLIESCQNGTLRPGSMLPPVRELAAQHGISASSAFEVVRELAGDGLLYSQHGAGTFVGRLPTRDDLFLLVLPGDVETAASFVGVRNGFESHLTRLGATCLTLSREQARSYRESGELEGLVATGEFCPLDDKPTWSGLEPLVCLRETWCGEAWGDTVFLDNEGGARQATEHLLGLGHRHIAFLGVHAEDENAGSLGWSKQRLEGFRAAMSGADCDADLVFCPRQMPENSHAGLREAGRETGARLARLLQQDAPGATAAVVTNAHSTEGAFEALERALVPRNRWPALVSFDDFTTSNSHLLSVVRPSWESLGRAGAALLWERRQGRLEAAPQQRAVPMELIPRFSCRPRQLKVPRPRVSPALAGVS